MIKNYKQFNESIKHLLVGPTKEEILTHLKKEYDDGKIGIGTFYEKCKQYDIKGGPTKDEILTYLKRQYEFGKIDIMSFYQKCIQYDIKGGPNIYDITNDIGIDKVLNIFQNNMIILFELYNKFKNDKINIGKIYNIINNLSINNLFIMFNLGYELTPQNINSYIINLSQNSTELRKRIIDVFYNEIHLNDEYIQLLKKLLSICIINREFDNVERIFEIHDFIDEDMNRIFINSLRTDNYDIVKLLIDKGVRNNNYHDCYLHALSNHNYKIIKLLVDNNYKVDNHVVRQVASSFRSDTQDYYLILDLVVKNNTEVKDDSLLLGVVWCYDVLKILLENGYNPNINNNSCLYNAVKGGYYDSCELLLKYGSSPNSRMEDEPICFPIKEDNIKMVKLLMDYKVKISHPYVLIRLCKSNEMKKLIKDYTGYVEKTNEGINHLLVGPTKEEIIRDLKIKVENGDDINYYDLTSWCIEIDEPEIIIEYINLIESKLNKNQADNNKYYAISKSIQKNKLDFLITILNTYDFNKTIIHNLLNSFWDGKNKETKNCVLQYLNDKFGENNKLIL